MHIPILIFLWMHYYELFAMREILVPGAQKRMLKSLRHLTKLVKEGADRDTLMYYTAQLMPEVTNQFAYMLEKKNETT